MRLFSLNVFSEYLGQSMNANQFGLQRVVDEFVFLTFLVGNDFIHHLPGLSIRDGAIDLLLHIWETFKAEHPNLYLVNQNGNSRCCFFSAFLVF